MKNDFIKEYWENQANTHKDSHEASWGDNFMIDLEIETIGKHLEKDAVILDVGCANGFSTFKQIKKYGLRNVTGIDFSENMIEQANKSKKALNIIGNINFKTGDVRKLGFEDSMFDIVYTTRVLINLPTWKEQIIAIDECLRVAKHDGKVILSEAFWEPLVLLNSLRTLKQLPALVEHDFNKYLKKQKLEDYLTNKNLSYTIDEFSSVYYLGSRFVRELVTEISKYPGYTNPINEIFYNIEKQYSGGGFGIQQAYIIKK